MLFENCATSFNTLPTCNMKPHFSRSAYPVISRTQIMPQSNHIISNSRITCKSATRHQDKYHMPQEIPLLEHMSLSDAECFDTFPLMTLATLAEQSFIPSSSKFRMMICETFVATGACPFHDDRRNLCAYAHDERIQTHYNVKTLKHAKSEQYHQSICRAIQPKQQNEKFSLPIHWPNRQVRYHPQSRLVDIPSFVKYDEPEHIRGLKKSLTKRSVFYFWSSFLENLEIVEKLDDKFAQTNESEQKINSQYHERFLNKTNRSYHTRRLPLFNELSQSPLSN